MNINDLASVGLGYACWCNIASSRLDHTTDHWLILYDWIVTRNERIFLYTICCGDSIIAYIDGDRDTLVSSIFFVDIFAIQLYRIDDGVVFWYIDRITWFLLSCEVCSPLLGDYRRSIEWAIDAIFCEKCICKSNEWGICWDIFFCEGILWSTTIFITFWLWPLVVILIKIDTSLK